MDTLFLSRLQFAVTIGFHFLFPPFTIGLSWLILVFLTRHLRGRDPAQLAAARFFTKVFALSFAMGVATGIAMEFQFGTNWARYARFVGDIFGAPLAAEAVLAFFLESTFVAVLVLGWDRVGERVRWLASLLVAAGATLSAFWIVAANSWQQTPAGYEMVDGRPRLVDFGAALFNRSTLPRFLHTVDGALITGSLFVMGVGAYLLLRKRPVPWAASALKTGLVVAFAASCLELGFGHLHAIQVAETQPLKLAAVEGHFDTGPRAPALVFGVPDADEGRARYAVKVPGLLSLLVFGDLDKPVLGLKSFPRELWPPLALTFYPFHLMVALGMLFIFLTGVGVLLLPRGRILRARWYLWGAVLAVPLPFLANELGWITAEVGRQPWIVYGLLRTADAFSPTVPAWQVLTSLVLFVLVYAFLLAAWVYLVRRMVLAEGRGGAAAAGGDA